MDKLQRSIKLALSPSLKQALSCKRRMEIKFAISTYMMINPEGFGGKIIFSDVLFKSKHSLS